MGALCALARTWQCARGESCRHISFVRPEHAAWFSLHRELLAIRRRWLAAAHPLGTALATTDGEGLFDGLDESGALRLRLAGGGLRVIHAGDVFLI